MFGVKDIFPNDSVGICLRLRTFNYRTDHLILIILRNDDTFNQKTKSLDQSAQSKHNVLTSQRNHTLLVQKKNT